MRRLRQMVSGKATATFAGRLKLMRLERGLTMEQLAEKVGVTKGLIYQYECGKVASPTAPLLYALAEALDVGPRWLAIGSGGHQALTKMNDVEVALILAFRGLSESHRNAVVSMVSSLERQEVSTSPEPPKPVLTAAKNPRSPKSYQK